MDPSNVIRVFVYKKGSGVIPNDVRLFGNDWIEFEIKVDEQDRIVYLMHDLGCFLCSPTMIASI